MSRLLSKSWFRWAAGIFLALLIALLSCACYFRVWSWRDFEVFQEMSRECPPVWRDLHWGRVYAGQDVEDVIAATKPPRIGRYGDFVELGYQEGPGLHFTGITITAKKGRLVSASAWSCTWSRVFFDEMTEEDRQDLDIAYEAHWQPIRQKRLEDEIAAEDNGGGN